MTGCACRQRRCILCEAMLSSESLSVEQACEVRGMISRQVYRPREMLFQQGMPVKDLFILKHGYVKLSAALHDGRSQGVQLGTPWSILGLDALHDETYASSAEAASDVQVCTIRRDALLDIMRQDHATSLQIIGLLNRELRRSVFHIRNLGVMDATERVASFLATLPTDAPLPEDEILLPMTRGDLGEILGLTLETVSRVLARLKKEGVVDMPRVGRQFRVLDWERLRVLGCYEEPVATTRCA